jgi:hypothetical protein
MKKYYFITIFGQSALDESGMIRKFSSVQAARDYINVDFIYPDRAIRIGQAMAFGKCILIKFIEYYVRPVDKSVDKSVDNFL